MVLLLLLLWLNVGFFLFVLFCVVLQTYGVCLLLLGFGSCDNDKSDCIVVAAAYGVFQYPFVNNAVLLRTTSSLDPSD